ncbi:MAG TPA: methyltransferase domain-containing protein, partial [Thermoplasmatales archaeon]|nr:methyltransferase domain-containing protein [Thermoplasmatales archaeon]
MTEYISTKSLSSAILFLSSSIASPTPRSPSFTDNYSKEIYKICSGETILFLRNNGGESLSTNSKFFHVEKEELIGRLMRSGYLSSKEVIDAMRAIPREIFVPGGSEAKAYHDTPLEIGAGQTISAPHMVAIMSEALRIRRDSRVLEVGTGTGYHAAVTAKIASEGHVYTVERIGKLAKKAMENFDKLGIKNVTVVVGDGSLGLE